MTIAMERILWWKLLPRVIKAVMFYAYRDFLNWLIGYDVQGVWFRIAWDVLTGWILSLTIATKVARKEIGGLLSAAPSSRYR